LRPDGNRAFGTKVEPTREAGSQSCCCLKDEFRKVTAKNSKSPFALCTERAASRQQPSIFVVPRPKLPWTCTKAPVALLPMSASMHHKRGIGSRSLSVNLLYSQYIDSSVIIRPNPPPPNRYCTRLKLALWLRGPPTFKALNR
jgi:hypothetical protein